MNFAPGVVLDNRYELLALLGEGGMGQVFKARHNRLGKIFAVKSLRHLSPDPAEQAKFLDAFETEARTLAELDHPALAKVSDFFEMGQTHFLVMEFIDGKTLSRVVELAPKNLSERRVVQWTRELTDVLSYLHMQKPPVIVRDLKPDNIMIDSKRRLRLIDFGISKRLKPGEGTREIVKGMGTAEYAPLEQYGSSTTDQRSDIYALGATLYFLLTEIAPPPAWKRASEGAEPVPPSQVNPTVSPQFEELVLSMMALKRENRPQTIAEVVSLLDSVPDPKKAGQSPPRAVPAVSAAPRPQVQTVGSGSIKGEWATVPSPPEYASPQHKQVSARRYGMPGSSLDRPKVDVKSGALERPKVVSCKSLRRYASTPNAVRVCPGRPLFAVAGRYLQVWDLNSEQMVSKLWSGEQQLVDLDFSPDGRTLFAAEVEGKVRRYDVKTGVKKDTLGRRSWGLFPDRNRAICSLYGKGQMAVVSDTSNLRIFDANSAKVSKTLDWHQTGLLSKLGRKSISLAASRKGFVATGGADGTLTIYEEADFEKTYHKKLAKGEILDLEFSRDDQFLAVADSRGMVFVLKAPDFEVVQSLKHSASPRTVSFSHDNRWIATGASDCQIRLFSLTTGRELLKLSHHNGAVLDLDFCDTEAKLVSVGNDRRLYVTELAW